MVDRLLHEGKADVKVLRSHDHWYGVTYKEDKDAVVASIRRLIEAGVYKERLYD